MSELSINTETKPKSRLKHWTGLVFQYGTALAVLVVAVATVGAVQAAGGPGDSGNTLVLTPTQVVTERAQSTDRYTIERRYTGLIEAAVAVDLGFQVAGKVVAAPVEVGDRVARGDVIGRLDTRRTEASQKDLRARLEQAQATIQLRETDFARAEALLARNATSALRRDEAAAALQTARSDYESLEAQLDSASADMTDAVLRAPFDGAVISKNFDLGDIITSGRSAVRLVQQSSTEARIGVPIDVIDDFERGEAVRLLWRGEAIEGVVKSDIPEISDQSRTAILVVALPEDVAPVEGESITLLIDEYIKAEGYWVPMVALVSDLRGLFAVQVAKQGADGQYTIARAPVQVLHTDGERAFVRGTLAEGDQIVVLGTNRVSPGQIVSITDQPADTAASDRG